MHKLLILFFALCAFGCTHRQIYEQIQTNARDQCVKEPLPSYDECLERSSQPYEEYKRERDEI